MFCMNCGKKIEDDMRFCPNCGTEFADSADTDDTEESSSEEPFYKRDLTASVNSKLWYKLTYTIVVIIAVACGVYFKWRMSGGHDDEAMEVANPTSNESRSTPFETNEAPRFTPDEKNVADVTDVPKLTKVNATTASHNVEHGEATKRGDTDNLWSAYKVFLDANYTSLKRKVEWEKFVGKQMSCSGRFQDAGEALLGGIYVTVIVDGKWVKLMINPSEKDKAMSLQKGDTITVSGRVSSRGDLLHVITLENGKINLHP